MYCKKKWNDINGDEEYYGSSFERFDFDIKRRENIMKIGILTLTLHTNYGGILQAYALQTVLERMGHEVEVLNKPFIPLKTKWKEIPKRIIKKLLGKDAVIFSEKRYNNEAHIINEAVWGFRKKYLHERIINNFYEIKKNDYDCIIVGSDQVWRPLYFKNQWETGIEDAFLAFTKGWNIKRIAYAVSLGVNTWEYLDNETKHCAKLIKQFDAISVREDCGQTLINKYLGEKSIYVLDPTLLLKREDYELLLSSKKYNQRYILTYFLDKSLEKERFVNIILQEIGYKRIDIKLNPYSQSDIKERILPSVENWLENFRDAKYVSFFGFTN